MLVYCISINRQRLTITIVEVALVVIVYLPKQCKILEPGHQGLHSVNLCMTWSHSVSVILFQPQKNLKRTLPESIRQRTNSQKKSQSLYCYRFEWESVQQCIENSQMVVKWAECRRWSINERISSDLDKIDHP